MIGLESRFINTPTGITLAPTPNYGAGPGYYGQTIPNRGTPIIPYTPSPDASIDYTNDPYQSLDIDKEFMAAVAQQLGQIGQGVGGGGRRGGGGGGGRAGKFGASGIKPAQPVKAGMDVADTAPNPAFYLNLPREQKYRYSGVS
tara:strand:- start:4526 stop:4957 length:432 start_codon:yes stop_codon:yes gene_type:complete